MVQTKGSERAMSDRTRPYIQAARLLPEPIAGRALALEEEEMARAEEFRLRAGQVPAVSFPEGERTLTGLGPVTGEDLEGLVERASRWSLHTVLDQVCRGFVTVEGGHRVGLCGTAVMEGGEIRSLRDLSSASVRIARQIPGAAAPVAAALWEGEQLQDTLILAPPGAGKTTLLRDLIRSLSQGEGHVPLRVGVADERGELAALYRGRPQMDLGEHTDVVEGCPKAVGMMLLLRGMTPQVLAVDEVTDGADVQAMRQAAGCGVVLLATAHGTDRADLLRRPLYRAMLEEGIFRRLVTICRDGAERTFRVEKLEGAAP